MLSTHDQARVGWQARFRRTDQYPCTAETEKKIKNNSNKLRKLKFVREIENKIK